MIATRPYGKHDVVVSEIGMGGHREGVDTRGGVARTALFFRSAQERTDVVRRALDAGVTYFDTTYGCELRSLGESLRRNNRRDGLFISGMRVDYFHNLKNDALSPTDYTRREVLGRVFDFGFDHIDQFILGAVESGDPLAMPRAILDEAIAELRTLQDKGVFRFLAFSCHDPDYAARFLDAFPVFDAAMVPYNFHNRVAEGAFANAARRHRIAWIGMKSLVWQVYGIPVSALKLLTPVPGRFAFDPTAPIARLALQFLLANPALTTMVPAMNTADEVDENVAASGNDPLTADELRHLEQYRAVSQAEKCVPLAMAGLLVDNLRVRAHAIGHLQHVLQQPPHGLNWEADDIENRARQHAASLLRQLRKDDTWAPLLRGNAAVEQLLATSGT